MSFTKLARTFALLGDLNLKVQEPCRHIMQWGFHRNCIQELHMHVKVSMKLHMYHRKWGIIINRILIGQSLNWYHVTIAMGTSSIGHPHIAWYNLMVLRISH